MATSSALLRLPVALVALAAFTIGGCNTPPQFLPSYQPGGPQGILDGTVTYSGPLPCTENGHVLGAAVFLAFDTRLLPPPDGLGTTAASLGALGGDVLFGGIIDRLTFNMDGSSWCPDPSAPPVTVSGDWSIGPLPGGEYEVRGFYDLHGQFDPVFSISKLPHQGDIAGGAIDNVSQVLMGAAPVYRRIALGAKQPDGSYQIPDTGSHIGGIAVTLGLQLPLGLPIFYPKESFPSLNICKGGAIGKASPPPSTDVTKLTMPADYGLPTFDPGNLPGTEQSFFRVGLGAGVAPSEVPAASANPFNLPVQSPPPTLAFSWQDVNGDGMLDLAHDHIAASGLIPSLFPLSIFSKLASPNNDLTAQASPAVIIQGLTLYKSLGDTALWGQIPPMVNLQTDVEVFVGITPAVLCLDPTDFSPMAVGKLVVPHLKDCNGNPLLMDQQGTLNALSKQFGRPIKLGNATGQETCIPRGRYAMNLVYGTGQAWSVPNEAGVCAATETQSPDGTQCIGATPMGMTPRARLLSQDIVLTIDGYVDSTYCGTPEHQTPDECCPALTDGSARVDPTTGDCKCPDPKNPLCK